MSRPRKHHLTKQVVSVRLEPADIERALAANGHKVGSLYVPPDLSAALSDAVRAGTAAIERAQRIGAQGYEVGSSVDGIEVLFRANTPRAALALQGLIKNWENMMNHEDYKAILRSDSEHDATPSADWGAALASMRRFVIRNGEREACFLDNDGKACMVQFLVDPGEQN